MQTRNGVRSGALIAILMLLCAHTASAQDARAVVKKMSALYNNAKTYQATMHTSMMMGPMGTIAMNMNIKTEGEKKSVQTSAAAGAGQQGGMGGAFNSQMVDDGKNLYIYMPVMNQYMKMPHPAGKTGAMGMSAGPMGNMMPGDLTGDKGTYKMLPLTTLNGRPTYVISYTPPAGSPMQGNFTLYVDKATYHLKQMKAIMGAPNRQGNMSMSMSIDNEKFNAPIPASTFVFIPPKGATEMHGGPGMMGAPGMSGGH